MIDIESVYKIICDLGGCDAKDEYSKGWDDAISAIEYEISRLISYK